MIFFVLTGCGDNTEDILNDYKEAVLNDDIESLITMLSDEEVTVTEDEAKAHAKLVQEHYTEETLNRALEKISQNIERQEGDVSQNLPGEFKTIMVVEKIDGEVNLSVNREEVRAPLERAVFTYEFNGEEITTGDESNDAAVIDNLIPGIYTFEGTGEMNDTSFDMTVDVNFNEQNMVTVSDQAVILNFQVNNAFKVENMKFFVNDEDVTDLYREDIGLGPILLENFEVYATGDYNGQEINTNKANVETDNAESRYTYIELNFDSDEQARIDTQINEEEKVAQELENLLNSSSNAVDSLYDNYETALNRNSVERQESILKHSFKNDEIPSNVMDHIEAYLDSESSFEVTSVNSEVIEQSEDNTIIEYENTIEVTDEAGAINEETHTVTLESSNNTFKVTEMSIE